MKFEPDSAEGTNAISRHEPGRVWVNGAAPVEHAVLVPWAGPVQPWGVQDFEQLDASHFERIATLEPQVVIFGSGSRLRFPPAALLRPLIQRRIGVETMDTAAACRTYNVLAAERRAVVAALLL